MGIETVFSLFFYPLCACGTLKDIFPMQSVSDGQGLVFCAE